VRVVVNLIVLRTSHTAVYVTSRAVQRAAIILLNHFLFEVAEADASSELRYHTPMEVSDAFQASETKISAFTRRGTVLKLAIRLKEKN
jgi:hypothetical protein